MKENINSNNTQLNYAYLSKIYDFKTDPEAEHYHHLHVPKVNKKIVAIKALHYGQSINFRAGLSHNLNEIIAEYPNSTIYLLAESYSFYIIKFLCKNALETHFDYINTDHINNTLKQEQKTKYYLYLAVQRMTGTRKLQILS